MLSSSALRVSFQGSTRIDSNGTCSRLYFKFNDTRYCGPMTIEAVQYDKWRFDAPDLMDQQFFWVIMRTFQKGRLKLNYGWVGVIMVSALVISLSDGNQCPG